MIVKNLTITAKSGAAGTRNLIRYIFKYILNKEKQVPTSQRQSSVGKNAPPFVIKHNVTGRSVEGYIKQFDKNTEYRIYKRSDQVLIHHTILSWSPKDSEKITDKTLRAIAREYIRLRGENALYVCCEHRDKRHRHLHFAIGGNFINGLANSMSKKNLSH